jgi:hypothetical protein
VIEGKKPAVLWHSLKSEVFHQINRQEIGEFHHETPLDLARNRW